MYIKHNHVGKLDDQLTYGVGWSIQNLRSPISKATVEI